jgi:hypothetical protein
MKSKPNWTSLPRICLIHLKRTIEHAQQTFTGAIATLWNMAEEIGIDPKLKAVSRLVVGWAIEELPKQIQDPANNLEIKRQLKIFRRSLLLI